MKTLEKLQHATVKFEQLTYFTGADSDGPDLNELLNEHDDDKLTALFGIDTEGLGDGELMLSLEDNYTGYFFANAHTPIRRHHSKEAKGYGFSWGHTTFTLIHASSFEKLVDKAVVWAELEHERMKNETK